MKALQTQMNNGVDIITINLAHTKAVTVQILTRVGSRYESLDQWGISHFLEHMCFKGTEHISGRELVRQIEALGAETNAFTGKEYTGYYIKGAARHWKKFIKLVADIYLAPAFPEKDLEVEKGVVKGEIDMYADDPMSVASLELSRLMHGDMTPVGRSIIGTHESVDAFTRDDLMRYHKKHYHGANTAVIVSGPIKTPEVRKEVKKYFAALPAGIHKNPKKPQLFKKSNTPHTTYIKRPTDQSHVIMAVPGIPREHPDGPALMVATQILGGGMSSRLFQKVREEMGAGYYISARSRSANDYGTIGIRYGTEPSRIREVAKACWNEIDRAKNDITDAEIRDAKQAMIGATELSLETSDAWADWYGFHYLLTGKMRAVNYYTNRLKKVDRAEVIRVMKKYYRRNKVYSVVVGPKRVNKLV